MVHRTCLCLSLHFELRSNTNLTRPKKLQKNRIDRMRSPWIHATHPSTSATALRSGLPWKTRGSSFYSAGQREHEHRNSFDRAAATVAN
jgi:hypothetical protein